jgi:type IV secretion system protein VirD4
MASMEEITKSLFRIDKDDNNTAYGGLPLFADDNSVYVEKEDAHTLVYGLTGSKKTRLIAMPALRTYAIAGESFIASDPKGELYAKTYSLLKERDYNIVVLNLRDPLHSNAWNPLRIPYLQYNNGQKDKAIEFVLDLSNSITSNGHSSNDSYWDVSGANMLAGLILILFEHAKENEVNFKSLRALRTQAFKIVDKEKPYIQDNYLRNIDKSSYICSLLSGTAEVTENTRSCIISIFDHAMCTFFCQESLIDMLSQSDFDMKEIGTKKTAVFLVTPDENTVYNKLVSVFIKQCYGELIREAENNPNNRLPIRVNYVLDEFANLPAIPDFPAMITASRSRNIRFNLFIQSQNQLVDRYGFHAQTIKGNCENWVFLHSRDYSLLDELVSLSGMKNSELPLISAVILQTLNKEKGEAFVLNKRLYPYIASLWDIDKYPNVIKECQPVLYPENTSKADAVFDFKNHCENIEANYMLNDELILEPIFTSIVPADNVNEKTDEKLEEKNNKKTEEEPSSKVTLERYGSSVGHGWHGLLAPIFEEINLYNSENKKNEIEIGQIKEKYGTLNIYTTRCPDYIKGMISLAEEESGHTCEICGARGETVKVNGWYTTLCHRHAKAKKAAGNDANLLLKLNRKFMETYEYSRWSRTYNPVFKRLLRINWFITKNKVNGVFRTVKLERENQRTNFYVKIGKEYRKHGLYVQWSENDEKTLHDGYWHVMEGNERESGGMLERQTAEKEAVSKIYYSWGRRPYLEILKMVSFEEGKAFPQCSVLENSDDYWIFVKEYLVKNNIKMTGAEHHKYGIPIIENNGNVYAFTLSYSEWGKLMAEAFDPDNYDKSAYLKWAGERPEGEVSWINPDMEDRG